MAVSASGALSLVSPRDFLQGEQLQSEDKGQDYQIDKYTEGPMLAAGSEDRLGRGPACGLGLEGIVSKDRTRSYRSGRSKTWLKIKNPHAPGVLRFEDRDAPA
jgi:hypothetical protein